jgi:hypothetical protein
MSAMPVAVEMRAAPSATTPTMPVSAVSMSPSDRIKIEPEEDIWIARTIFIVAVARLEPNGAITVVSNELAIAYDLRAEWQSEGQRGD